MSRIKKIIILFISVMTISVVSYIIINPVSASPQIVAQDNFDSGNWNGGTGWVNSWSRNTLIYATISSQNPKSNPNCARLSGSNSYIQRTVDLSAYESATLTYSWLADGNWADSLLLGRDYAYVKIHDGSRWHTVQTMRKGDDKGVYNTTSIDLTGYNLTNNFIIRFESDFRLLNLTSYISFDDVVVTGVLPPPISVEMYNDLRNAQRNSITPYFRIRNTSRKPINLSSLKLRYYYTIDGELPQNFDCYWSTVGKQNITGTFVKMEGTYDKADYYLEIGFTSGAGTIAPGAIVDIQTRFHKTNWSNYSQTNDYSFNSSATNYVRWEKVTGHINDKLVWGVEPEPIDPNISLPHEIMLEFYNARRNGTTNTISPYFKITNVGDTTVNFRDLTLRYYYTIDGELTQNFVCDWSTVGNENVLGTFVKVGQYHPQVDYYLEIGFSQNAGFLSPGSIAFVQTRIHKTNWSNYTQGNDYSFNGSSSNYVQWEKVTAYVNNVLVWGIEPFATEPTPTPTPTITPTSTPTPEPTPVPTPFIGQGTGLRGEYYDGINLTNIKEIRLDSNINFEWGYNAPVSGVDKDAFSVRWIGKIVPKYTEQYTFHTFTDGGIRLWIDNVLIIDKWISGGESSQSIFLMSGLEYDIKMEYFSYNDNSIARLSWSSNIQDEEVVPQSQLYPPKIFTANMHNVRTSDNGFIIGDLIPLKAIIDVLWQISNPVISIDLNLKKNDGSNSGFVIEALRKGNTILKDYIKIFVNEEQIKESDYTVWVDELREKINIQVLDSFSYGDRIEIRYVVKATGTEDVFNIGIDKYLTDNNLKNVDVQIKYEVSQWVDSGLVLSYPYSINSVVDPLEKNAFIANIKIEDPILLE